MSWSALAAVLLLAFPALSFAALPPPARALPAAPDSHVVVAVIDTGINPYHAAFAAPDLAAPPSTLLPGFPADARPLALCLDAQAHPDCASYAGAVRHDAAIWKGLQPVTFGPGGWQGPTYTIPGTRIVAAVSIAGDPGGDAFVGPTRILDDEGHGTASASLVAGQGFGLCPECLLVVVEGPGDLALRWARDQPWIDVVTNSWGLVANLDWPPPPLGEDMAGTTRDMVQRGQTVLFAAGNGLGNGAADPWTSVPDYLLPGETTYTSEYTGPDWVVTVGAADPGNGQPVGAAARPVDIAAAGLHVAAADAFSREGNVDFTGTSASAPLAAGVFGDVLLQMRRALQDQQVGPRPGEVVAQGTAPLTALAGPLADGVLTRGELQRLVFATARPCALALDACPGLQPWPFPAHPWGWTMPALPVAYPLLEGYGVVDAQTRDAAVRAGLGAPLAPRPEADAWARADSAARQQLWGSWPDGARWGDLLPT